jgi:hypothetical protein
MKSNPFDTNAASPAVQLVANITEKQPVFKIISKIKLIVSFRSLSLCPALCLFVFCVVFGLYSFARAELTIDENKIKAGFVYRFILFTKWPAQQVNGAIFSGKKEHTIGILGNDIFADLFSQVEGKPVHGNKILTIKRFVSFVDSNSQPDCEVLFIDRSEEKNLKKILLKLGNSPVLTVSDIDNFCEKGGMINLLTVNQRVRFKVNLSKVKKSGLSLSSDFLRAAFRVLM